MKTTAIITSLLSVTLLSACASHIGTQRYTSDPTHSKAWNMARAANMDDLEDMDRVEAQQVLKANGTNLDDAVISGGLGMFSQPLGLSAGLTSGLNVAAALLSAEKKNPALATHIRLWAPKSRFQTKDAAFEYFQASLRPVIVQAINDWDLPPQYSLGQIDIGDADKYGQTISVDISGGECDRDGYRCYAWFQIPGPVNIQNGAMPDFYGTGPAWQSVSDIEIAATQETTFKQYRVAMLPGLRLAREIASGLPENSFLYISPAQNMAFMDDSGEMKFVGLPMIIADQTYYFIRPAGESST